jgi:predicted heme/steroid binding protein
MIKTSSNGNIVIEVGGRSYDLSVSDQYADFLLWVTSPDKKTVIDQDTFKVAEDVPEEYQAKAARYADFLTDYSQRRQGKLNDIKQTLNTDQRESDIKAFIERLANTEA